MNAPAPPPKGKEQRIKVVLPTFHADQVRAWRRSTQTKRFALRAGRRWGKTELALAMAADGAIKGESIGWFAPDYKISRPSYVRLEHILDPISKSTNKTDGVITTIAGGSVEVWTLENDRAGRSRKYHKVFIDEAAFGKKDLFDVWERSIEPTLLDYGGEAWAVSNTNGIDPDNFFWAICNKPELGWKEYWAPTINNPNMPLRRSDEDDLQYMLRRAETFAKLRREKPPLVYKQEYDAEFVDWSGVAFFALPNLLINDGVKDCPVDLPTHSDSVFAVIDSATKTKLENDGTGVTFWCVNTTGTHKLICLDYDLLQIEGALLETWLPSVYQRLEMFARECNCRMGSLGVWIEDKSSGTILLQQSIRKGLPAFPIDSKLTAMGKQERAINVSGYVYSGQVKLAANALNRTLIYKETSRNHLLHQVLGFRVGNKDQDEDDLLDSFTYAIAIALGNAEGF